MSAIQTSISISLRSVVMLYNDTIWQVLLICLFVLDRNDMIGLNKQGLLLDVVAFTRIQWKDQAIFWIVWVYLSYFWCSEICLNEREILISMFNMHGGPSHTYDRSEFSLLSSYNSLGHECNEFCILWFRIAYISRWPRDSWKNGFLYHKFREAKRRLVTWCFVVRIARSSVTLWIHREFRLQ